ncbi:hypothetical protein [Streptomyces sp. NPDC046942]|uniref:hypothetical protein n=1 Tax=Streptomyces sp. NPDC046942 TaxID=3155137 RepID=UPI0033C73416
MSPHVDDLHPPVGPGAPAVPPAPQHSLRGPERTPEPAMTGLDNEVWSYGEEAYPIPRDHLHVRERPPVRDAADAGAEVAL